MVSGLLINRVRDLLEMQAKLTQSPITYHR